MADNQVTPSNSQSQEKPCIRCKKPRTDLAYKHCGECRALLNEKAKYAQRVRMAQGKCKLCSNPSAPGKRYCNKCRALAKGRAKKKRKIVRLCGVCGEGPIDHRYRYCDKCRKRRSNGSVSDWRNRMLAAGKCPVCCKKNDTKATVCSRCCARHRAARMVLKRDVMNLYGGKCSCCGETELSFLTLDHINNDGAEKRRSGEHSTGMTLYRWIRRNGTPADLACLCMNCQWSKRIDGVCVHQSAMIMTDGAGI